MSAQKILGLWIASNNQVGSLKTASLNLGG